MDNLEFRQITEIDKDNLEIMTNWMYKTRYISLVSKFICR